MEEGHGWHKLQTITSSGIEVENFDNRSSGELMHGHSRYREDLVKFGGQNDWGEVIEKVVKGK